MKFTKFIALLFFMFVVSAAGASNEEEEAKETPEEKVKRVKETAKTRFEGADERETIENIRAQDKKRIDRLTELLHEKKTLLKYHFEGKEELPEDDIEFYTRQVKAFQKKLDHHESMTHDEYEEYLREKARTINDVRLLKIPEL